MEAAEDSAFPLAQLPDALLEQLLLPKLGPWARAQLRITCKLFREMVDRQRGPRLSAVLLPWGQEATTTQHDKASSGGSSSSSSSDGGSSDGRDWGGHRYSRYSRGRSYDSDGYGDETDQETDDESHSAGLDSDGQASGKDGHSHPAHYTTEQELGSLCSLLSKSPGVTQLVLTFSRERPDPRKRDSWVSERTVAHGEVTPLLQRVLAAAPAQLSHLDLRVTGLELVWSPQVLRALGAAVAARQLPLTRLDLRLMLWSVAVVGTAKEWAAAVLSLPSSLEHFGISLVPAPESWEAEDQHQRQAFALHLRKELLPPLFFRCQGLASLSLEIDGGMARPFDISCLLMSRSLKHLSIKMKLLTVGSMEQVNKLQTLFSQLESLCLAQGCRMLCGLRYVQNKLLRACRNLRSLRLEGFDRASDHYSPRYRAEDAAASVAAADAAGGGSSGSDEEGCEDLGGRGEVNPLVDWKAICSLGPGLQELDLCTFFLSGLLNQYKEGPPTVLGSGNPTSAATAAIGGAGTGGGAAAAAGASSSGGDGSGGGSNSNGHSPRLALPHLKRLLMRGLRTFPGTLARLLSQGWVGPQCRVQLDGACWLSTTPRGDAFESDLAAAAAHPGAVNFVFEGVDGQLHEWHNTLGVDAEIGGEGEFLRATRLRFRPGEAHTFKPVQSYDASGMRGFVYTGSDLPNNPYRAKERAPAKHGREEAAVLGDLLPRHHTFVYRLNGRLPLVLGKVVQKLAKKGQLGALRDLVVVDAAKTVGGVGEASDPTGPLPGMAKVLLPRGVNLTLVPCATTLSSAGLAGFQYLTAVIHKAAPEYRSKAGPGVQPGQFRLLL